MDHEDYDIRRIDEVDDDFVDEFDLFSAVLSARKKSPGASFLDILANR